MLRLGLRLGLLLPVLLLRLLILWFLLLSLQFLLLFLLLLLLGLLFLLEAFLLAFLLPVAGSCLRGCGFVVGLCGISGIGHDAAPFLSLPVAGLHDRFGGAQAFPDLQNADEAHKSENAGHHRDDEGDEYERIIGK